jgi:carbon storage regulator
MLKWSFFVCQLPKGANYTEDLMLVLTRQVGEEIVIDGDIRVIVVSIKGDKVRLGISAPPAVVVDRQEIHERRAETNLVVSDS